MKTYQFITFTIVGLVIAAALLYKKHKKPCGCNGAAENLLTEEKDGE